MSEETSFSINALAPIPGSRKPRKRKGMGKGSGNGKTGGRGHKGQKSRAGHKIVRGFEGGQMPLHRRLPKVGFASRQRVLGNNIYQLVTLGELQEAEIKGDFTVKALEEAGLISDLKGKVKILGDGELKKKLVVEVHKVTASAGKAIEAAGGEVRIISQEKAKKQ